MPAAEPAYYAKTIPECTFGDTLSASGKVVCAGQQFHALVGMMAFYGDRLEDMNPAKPLKASGKVSLRRGVTDSDVLLGFFHAEHSLASGGSDAIGMPPDFLGVSIGGPSRDGFMFSPAYRLHNTERRINERGPYLLPNGAPHDWTLEFAPGGPGP